MEIMFVCTGNICRSVMAHLLLEKKLKEKNREDIKVYSSGTYAINGDIATWEEKEIMKEEYNIDMSCHRAINMEKSPIKEMELVLCATKNHKVLVLNHFPKLKDKVFTMKEYVSYDRIFHDKIDIKDPWGYDMDTYRSCISEVDECVNLLLEKI